MSAAVQNNGEINGMNVAEENITIPEEQREDILQNETQIDSNASGDHIKMPEKVSQNTAEGIDAQPSARPSVNPEDEDAEDPQWTHLLAESDSMVQLQNPVQHSARIQYTSIAVCNSHIAMGANTGCIYVFARSNLKYLQMLPSDLKDGGAVTKMLFAPDNQTILAYGTSKGFVVVVELQTDKRNKADKLRSTFDHKDSVITSLCWNPEGDKLYIGDNNGKVTFTNVSSSRAKVLFKLASELVMKLDSPVVQIDTCEDKLLVSTYNKTFLGNTSKQQFQTIGKKLRDGRFGSCFYSMTGIKQPVIYCARPNSRIWEVDYDGNVLNTQNFKQILAVPPLPVVSLSEPEGEYSLVSGDYRPQSLTLPQLIYFCNKYLISYTDKGLYIFNPSEVKFVLWTADVSDIEAVSCLRNDIYVMQGTGQVRKLSFHTIPKLVSHIYCREHYNLCSSLISQFREDLLRVSPSKYITPELLVDLIENIGNNPCLKEQLQSYLNRLNEKIEAYIKARKSVSEENEQVPGGFYKNQHGIYVRESRSNTCESEELPDPGDKLLNAVVARRNSKLDDAKSLDSISVGSNESDGPRLTSVAIQARGALFGFAGKLKQTLSKTQISEENEPQPENEAANKDGPADVTTLDRSDSQLSKGSPGDSSYESDVSFPKRETAPDNISQGSFDPDAQSEKEPSVDSLSLSSNELALSISAGTPDPEPIYAKSFVPPKRRGKKKKPKTIDLGGGSEPTPERKTKRSNSAKGSSEDGIREVKRAVSVPDKSLSSRPKLSISPVPLIAHETTVQNVSNSNDGNMARENLQETSVETRDRPDLLTVSSSNSLSSSTELAGDIEPVASPKTESNPSSPKASIFSVKSRIQAKVQTTAQSIMQSIKETGQKLSNKTGEMTEIPAMTVTTDVDAGPRSTDTVVNLSPRIHVKDYSKPENDDAKDSDTSVMPELDVLIEASEIVRGDINGSEILYNPSACRKVLQEWTTHLHTMLRTTHQQTVVELINDYIEEKYEDQRTTPSCDVSEPAQADPGDETHVDKQSSEIHGDRKNDLENDDNKIQPMSQPPPTPVTRKDIELISNYLNEGCIQCPDFSSPVNVDAFIDLPAEQSETLKELTTMCIEFSVHGHPSEYFNPYPELTSNNKMVNVCKEANEVESTSDFQEMCSFLKCYFCYMDVERVRQSILWSPQGERLTLWSTYLQLSQKIATKDESILGLFDGNQLNDIYDRLRSCVLNDRRSYLAVLKRLFVLQPKQAAQFCSEVAVNKYIDPIDVLYIVKESKQFKDLFIYYNQLYCEARQPSRDDPIRQMCADAEVCFSLLECLLQSGPPQDKLMCLCGFPRPFAHKIEWKKRDLIDRVLKLPQCTNTSAVITEELLLKYGYWDGYLRIIRDQPSQKSTFIKMMMQFSDKELFSENSDFGYIPYSEDEWLQILQLKSSQRKHVTKEEPCPSSQLCLKCGCEISLPHDESGEGNGAGASSNSNECLKDINSNSITWEYIASKLVQYVGASRSINMLQEANIPRGALSFSFYQGILRNRITENQQKLLVHNMLERLDTYLWSRRSTIVPPKVVMAASAEKAGIDKKGTTGVELEKLFTDLRTKSATLTVEEPESHWGVKVKMNSPCPTCGMNLSHVRAAVQLGLIFFQCGHGFHKLCNSSGKCSVCH